jgi:hypothetical protein
MSPSRTTAFIAVVASLLMFSCSQKPIPPRQTAPSSANSSLAVHLAHLVTEVNAANIAAEVPFSKSQLAMFTSNRPIRSAIKGWDEVQADVSSFTRAERALAPDLSTVLDALTSASKGWIRVLQSLESSSSAAHHLSSAERNSLIQRSKTTTGQALVALQNVLRQVRATVGSPGSPSA